MMEVGSVLPTGVQVILLNRGGKRLAGLSAGPPAWPEQAASLLKACFPGEDGYPTSKKARAEVNDLRENATCLIIAVDAAGVAGLVGGLEAYRGRVWELHPLAVRADRRGQGIGGHLVRMLEEEALLAGAGTVILGTDDTEERTSIGGRSILPGALESLRCLRDTGGHPFAFYLKLGYEVTGVVPDANGPGKHDILMSKSLRLH